MSHALWFEKVWQIDTTPRGESYSPGDKGSKKVFDSEDQLNPLRVYIYTDAKGAEGIRFYFTSSDKGDDHQRFEFVIDDKTYSIVTLRPDPITGEAFG